jgi:hypothetical protein
MDQSATDRRIATDLITGAPKPRPDGVMGTMDTVWTGWKKHPVQLFPFKIKALSLIGHDGHLFYEKKNI